MLCHAKSVDQLSVQLATAQTTTMRLLPVVYFCVRHVMLPRILVSELHDVAIVRFAISSYGHCRHEQTCMDVFCVNGHHLAA